MIATEDAARMARQIVQKAKLSGGRGDQLSIHAELHGAGIDLDILKLEHRRRTWPLKATQHSLDASYQLSSSERLRNVVIRPHLQTVDAVILRSTRRKEDDGNDAQCRILA